MTAMTARESRLAAATVHAGRIVQELGDRLADAETPALLARYAEAGARYHRLIGALIKERSA